MSEETTTNAAPTGVVNFSTSSKAKNRKLDASYNFGKNLGDACELFGEDVVFSGFLASAKIDAQAMIRRRLENGKISGEGENKTETPYTDEEILTELEGWKPGVSTRTRQSPMDKIAAQLGSLTEDQKAALLAQLAALTGAPQSEDE